MNLATTASLHPNTEQLRLTSARTGLSELRKPRIYRPLGLLAQHLQVPDEPHKSLQSTHPGISRLLAL